MACCALLLTILAKLSFRPDGTRVRGLMSIPLISLAVVAVAEFGLAVLLRSAHTQSRASDGHGMHPMTQATSAAHWSASAFLIALALIFVLVAPLIGRQRENGVRVFAGTAMAAIAAASAASPASSHSNLLLMVTLELIMVAPLTMLGTHHTQGDPDDVWVGVRGAVAFAAGTAVVAMLFAVHMRWAREEIFAATHAAWWATPLGLAAALGFWASVLRFRLPAAWRMTLIILVLETGSLLGLAMLLVPASPSPADTVGLSAVADQRLAGAWMMAVDLVVLATFLPVVTPRWSRHAPTPISSGPTL